MQHDVCDVGAHTYQPEDDYPDFSNSVAQLVVTAKADKGIIICGTGVGACIAANKIPGARASVCHDAFSARQGVEHDNMNILCIGANIIGYSLALMITKIFINARFNSQPKYYRRLKKVEMLEQWKDNKQ